MRIPPGDCCSIASRCIIATWSRVFARRDLPEAGGTAKRPRRWQTTDILQRIVISNLTHIPGFLQTSLFSFLLSGVESLKKTDWSNRVISGLEDVPISRDSDHRAMIAINLFLRRSRNKTMTNYAIVPVSLPAPPPPPPAGTDEGGRNVSDFISRYSSGRSKWTYDSDGSSKLKSGIRASATAEKRTREAGRDAASGPWREV